MLAKLGLCKAEGGVARRVLGVLDVPEAGDYVSQSYIMRSLEEHHLASK